MFFIEVNSSTNNVSNKRCIFNTKRESNKVSVNFKNF